MITVKSESDPKLTYKVSVGAGGLPYCTCPAFQFHTERDEKGRRICKHIKKVLPQLPRVKSEMLAGAGGGIGPRWVIKYCPKHGRNIYTAEIFGLRCLIHGS